MVCGSLPGLPPTPGSFFDGENGPGFLLRSTIGTPGPGFAMDVITRTFRDRAVKIKVGPAS